MNRYNPPNDKGARASRAATLPRTGRNRVRSMAPAAQSATAAMQPAAADPAAQVDYASLPDHVGYLLRLAQLRVWEDFYARLSATGITRSEEHTSELQSLMRTSYA